MTESNPNPNRRNAEKINFFADRRQSSLLSDFALLYELLAFAFDGLKEFGGCAILGKSPGEFAADCGLQDRAFDGLYKFAV